MRYGLSEDALKAITEVLNKFPEVEEARLYGSRVLGSYHPGSDIDLTLKGEQLNTTILNNVYWAMDDLLLPYKFDLSIFNQIENPELINHIERRGVVIYKR